MGRFQVSYYSVQLEVIVTIVIVSWVITYLRDVNNLPLYRGELIHLLSTMDIPVSMDLDVDEF